MHPKDAEGIANSIDPNQTAPLRAVWTGSALFAQACLSENLGTLRVCIFVLRFIGTQNEDLSTVKVLSTVKGGGARVIYFA